MGFDLVSLKLLCNGYHLFYNSSPACSTNPPCSMIGAGPERSHIQKCARVPFCVAVTSPVPSTLIEGAVHNPQLPTHLPRYIDCVPMQV